MKRPYKLLASLSIATLLFSGSNFVLAADEYTEDLTNPNGNIKASSAWSSSFTAQKAFDNRSDTYTWATKEGVPTGWLEYEFDVPKKISKYTLRTRTQLVVPGETPKTWDFEAFDGQKWIVLDHQENITNWKNRNEFVFDNDKAYSKYRINISANNGARNYVTIEEVEMMEKIAPPVTTAPTLDIQAPQTTVAGGTEFTTYAIVKNAKDLYAEDVKVKYDTNLFEFVKAEPASTGLHIYHEKQEAPGELRFIVASNGEQYGVNGEAQLLKLTFKAKNVPGKGKIDISAGLVADSKGTEVEPTVDGEEITVTGGFDADVNGDGKYSLGDVAIAGFHHSKDKAQWTNPKADVDKNDKVEDNDLVLIVQKILNP
ncbi:cohesin domain-containing protein [Aneurinibacillus uraniidurans]|uniref:cohesin domain-containing protein n=1 Tax=Aneurinibacillus uraniidurans TaxID=2966586 RepID=UPI00234B9ED5|nr:cohesin domain-containing protein [Aneurinibacillus sp. B1]WCN36515.1 cohesin domain-containing protein [Aneurinibacillus sp. B1]